MLLVWFFFMGEYVLVLEKKIPLLDGWHGISSYKDYTTKHRTHGDFYLYLYSLLS